MSEKVEFTRLERLTLANQFIILAKLSELAETNPEIVESKFDIDPRTSLLGAKKYYAKKARILIEGQERYYYEIFSGVIEDEETTPDEIGEEVHNIIQMYRDINYSISRLTEEEKASLDLEKLEWEGFDHRGKHYSFLRFFIETHTVPHYEEYFIDSHDGLSIVKYRNMLHYYYSWRTDAKSDMTVDVLRDFISKAY